jgi:hypothetical protein
MSEHKEYQTDSLDKLLSWWPELRKLTEHASVIGIRLVVEQKDRFGLGLTRTAAFDFKNPSWAKFFVEEAQRHQREGSDA